MTQLPRPIPEDPHLLASFADLRQVRDRTERNRLIVKNARRFNLPPDEYHQRFRQYQQQKRLQQDFKLLADNFKALDALADPVQQQYKLLRQASDLRIEPTLYQQLYQHYRQQQHRSRLPSWRRPALLWEGFWERLAQSMETWDILKVLENLGKLSILLAVLVFLWEIPQRAERNTAEQSRERYEAWQLLADTENSRLAAGGIKDALETLAKGCRARYMKPFERKEGLPVIRFNNVPVIGWFIPDPECVELRRLTLAGTHLPNVQLQGARLRDAILLEAGLWQADLRHADLTGAQLQRAKLVGANLAAADLTRAQLQGADLSGAQLGGAQLREANLKGANLIGAQLRQGQNLTADALQQAFCDEATQLPENLETCAHIPGMYRITAAADLTGANLRDFNLAKANLEKARLRRSNLRSTNLTDARLQGVDLTDALYDQQTRFPADVDLSALGAAYLIAPGNNLAKANFRQADLRGANLSQASLRGANLIDADLSEANLTGVDLTGILYSPRTQFPAGINPTAAAAARLIAPAADLQQAVLTQVDLSRLSLRNANLAGADLTGADLTDVDLTDADLNNADLRGAIGLTPQQLKQARNWETARYDAEVRSQLQMTTQSQSAESALQPNP